MKAINNPYATQDTEPVPAPMDNKSPENITAAEVGLSPVFANSQTACRFSNGVLSENVEPGDALGMMLSAVAKVRKGDLNDCEATLVAQAVALDAMFNALARKAARHMAGNLSAVETSLRLALKAQGQCRATLQTLAEIKNPRPVAFVKQANIAHGHQQINNEAPTDQASRACARGKSDSVKRTIESGHHEQGLDSGATSTAGGIDTYLEAVGALYRPSK